MDFLSIIQLVVQFVPVIKGLIDSASGNSDIIAGVKFAAPDLAKMLEQAGAAMFPKVAPELHIAAAAMAAFDPNVTKWVQGACNALITPSPALDVDGLYGPMTRSAVEKLQAQLGLKVDGWAGTLTQAALGSLLSSRLSLGPAASAPPAPAA